MSDGGEVTPRVIERFQARGHEHVQATHTSTVEVTTDTYLTPAGDCIVGIDADRAPTDLDEDFVAACQDRTASITLRLVTDDHTATIDGRGSPELTFESDRSLVARTSTYVDDRTVMVEADGAAADLDRGLIEALQTGVDLQAELVVE